MSIKQDKPPERSQPAMSKNPGAAQISESSKADTRRLKLVQMPPTSDRNWITPEPEATELRERIHTLQNRQSKKLVTTQEEETLPPAA